MFAIIHGQKQETLNMCIPIHTIYLANDGGKRIKKTSLSSILPKTACELTACELTAGELTACELTGWSWALVGLSLQATGRASMRQLDADTQPL